MDTMIYTWKSRDAAAISDIFSVLDGKMPQRKFTDIPHEPLDMLNDVAWAFITDEGHRGLIQVTGFTDDKRGVKIRYKLVEEPSVGWDPLPGLKLAAEEFSEEAVVAGGAMGRYEVRVNGRLYDMPFGYDIRLYAAGQSEPIHILNGPGGYMRYSAAKEDCKALWNGGNYVAITDRGTKRSQEIYLLAVAGDHVEQLKLPDYERHALGLVGPPDAPTWSSGSVPERWEGNDLHVKFSFKTSGNPSHSCHVVLHVEKPQNGSPVVGLKSCSSPEPDPDQ